MTGSGMKRRYASAMLRAVSDVAVATMSSVRRVGLRRATAVDEPARRTRGRTARGRSTWAAGSRSTDARAARRRRASIGVPARGERAVDVVCAIRRQTFASRRRSPTTPGPVSNARTPSIVAARRNDRDVADAADVLERAPLVAGEEQRVGDRHERRALPARGDVAHAEVAHDVDAGPLGDHRGFAESARSSAALRARCVWPCEPIARTSPRGTPASASTRDRRVGEPVAEVEREAAVLLRRAAGAARACSRVALLARCTAMPMNASSCGSMRPSFARRESARRPPRCRRATCPTSGRRRRSSRRRWHRRRRRGRRRAGSRRRAARAPRSASSRDGAEEVHDDRRLHGAAAASSSSRAPSRSTSQTSMRILSLRSRELVVRRAQIDHQVAERLAEPDHRARRDHVEHELGRGAGLHARRAGDDLGAGDRQDEDVDDVERVLRRRRAGDERRRRADAARVGRARGARTASFPRRRCR